MSFKPTVKVAVQYLGCDLVFEFKREKEKDKLIRYKEFQKTLEALEDKSEAEKIYREYCLRNLVGVSGPGANDENGVAITAEDIKNGDCFSEVIKAATEGYMYILRGAEAEAKKELILD